MDKIAYDEKNKRRKTDSQRNIGNSTTERIGSPLKGPKHTITRTQKKRRKDISWHEKYNDDS